MPKVMPKVMLTDKMVETLKVRPRVRPRVRPNDMPNDRKWVKCLYEHLISHPLPQTEVKTFANKLRKEYNPEDFYSIITYTYQRLINERQVELATYIYDLFAYGEGTKYFYLTKEGRMMAGKRKMVGKCKMVEKQVNVPVMVVNRDKKVVVLNRDKKVVELNRNENVVVLNRDENVVRRKMGVRRMIAEGLGEELVIAEGLGEGPLMVEGLGEGPLMAVKTDEKVVKTDEKVVKTYEKVEKMDEKVEKMDEMVEKMDEMVEKTDEKVEKTDEKVEKTHEKAEKTHEIMEMVNFDKIVDYCLHYCVNSKDIKSIYDMLLELLYGVKDERWFEAKKKIHQRMVQMETKLHITVEKGGELYLEKNVEYEVKYVDAGGTGISVNGKNDTNNL